MSDTKSDENHRLKGKEKLAVDMGPLVVMLIGYFFAERIAPLLDNLTGMTFFAEEGNALFVAVALFLPAFAVAFVYSVVKERRVAPMLLVTAVIVVVLSALTLILQNKTFTYIKPTITYAIFALVLGGGQLAGRNFLRMVFDGALHMPEQAWRTLTWRFVGFFIFAALLNEILWRFLTADCVTGETCSGEATWINIKIFGFTALYFVFLISQGPFIAKNMKEAEKNENKTAPKAPEAEMQMTEKEETPPHNPSTGLE